MKDAIDIASGILFFFILPPLLIVCVLLFAIPHNSEYDNMQEHKTEIEYNTTDTNKSTFGVYPKPYGGLRLFPHM